MWIDVVHTIGFGGLVVISLLTDLLLTVVMERTGPLVLAADLIFLISLVAWLWGVL